MAVAPGTGLRALFNAKGYICALREALESGFAVHLMTTTRRRAGVTLVGIAYLSFVVLGLPAGLLGVAWPSMRETFRIPLDALGALLISSEIGFLLFSFNSGRISSRIGVGLFLLIGGILRAVGLLGFALAPAWWVLVLFGLFVGMGGGALDAGSNTYFAMNRSARLMNWLHASFGLGAAIGPLIMTTILVSGQSWRWGYATVSVLQLFVSGCLVLVLSGWQNLESELVDKQQGLSLKSVASKDTLRLPLVWISIVLFFVYAGVEATSGQWTYTLFTEARSMAVSTAGFWVSVYWGSFTAGRLLFGIVADRFELVPSLRLSMLGAICASLLIWANIANDISLLGLTLMGLALAPIYPLLVSATPRRLGAENAANAIGFQVSAASLGIAALPGFAGVLAQRSDLEVIGPFLLVASVVMFLLHEVAVGRER